MNQNKIKFVTFSLLFGFISSNHSFASDKIITYPNSEKLLHDLNTARELKEKSQANFASITRKRSELHQQVKGLPEEQKKRILHKSGEKWLSARQQSNNCMVEYLSKLTSAYLNLPESHSLITTVKEELAAQHPDQNKNKFTQSYYNQLTLLSNACHPELIKGKMNPKKAYFLTKLLKPPSSIKFEDRMHFIGITVEPQQWHVQAAYSLAQLRAGNISIARKENKKLLRKAERLSKKGIELNYRKEGNIRTYKSLQREFLLHRALIESHAKEKEDAKKYLSEALEIEEQEQIKKEQKFLQSEIDLLINS